MPQSLPVTLSHASSSSAAGFRSRSGEAWGAECWAHPGTGSLFQVSLATLSLSQGLCAAWNHMDPSKLRRLWGWPGPMDIYLVAELPPCSPGKSPASRCSLLVVGIQGLVVLAGGCVTSQDGHHGQRGGFPCHVPYWALSECPRPALLGNWWRGVSLLQTCSCSLQAS